MTENCLVLTGGPGTGKTTTVNAILQLLEDQAERLPEDEHAEAALE